MSEEAMMKTRSVLGSADLIKWHLFLSPKRVGLSKSKVS